MSRPLPDLLTPLMLLRPRRSCPQCLRADAKEPAASAPPKSLSRPRPRCPRRAGAPAPMQKFETYCWLSALSSSQRRRQRILGRDVKRVPSPCAPAPVLPPAQSLGGPMAVILRVVPTDCSSSAVASGAAPRQRMSEGSSQPPVKGCTRISVTWAWRSCGGTRVSRSLRRSSKASMSGGSPTRRIPAVPGRRGAHNGSARTHAAEHNPPV